MAGTPDIAEAEALQERLKRQLDLTTDLGYRPAEVVGLDVTYETGTDRVVGAAVVVGLPDLAVREVALAYGEATFPYLPGFLALREAPILVAALSRLRRTPEVLVCDGYGLAHPRRFGLACHLGVLTGLPTFGVAKTAFTATFAGPGTARGDWTPLIDAGETVGRALRTRPGVKPVFVSVGHRIALDTAADLTLALSRYRLPEATRQADLLSREALRHWAG